MSTLDTLQDLLMKDYQLGREQVGPEVELVSLGVDSLGMVDLMFQVEETFSVEIPDEDPPKLHTIGDVVAFIDGLVSARRQRSTTDMTRLPADT